ncbi:DUF1134 domain-containing protein [Microvirga tunisiensis]|jgi:hypothetical protein|uniref:DUF1134 domain-containing protein n=1 Tax=Microvirga tunisiensis TaxID=2108360 RepID=A0A5N7MK23_9HYPH|nr:DUF1134 domain-containing protein [Microvirga tunisiensis]MPR09264.1 DUF1134 domain-containing protein [Microvirga tunisiensis]MPR27432.1 DUF1134 domain-containing protein [Microvirga tunisiensis]
MRSRSTILAAAAFAALIGTLPLQASAQTVQRAYASNPGSPDSFNSNELVESGHQFFGSASRGIALALQEAIRRWGEPNGYILGQEASGAFFGGLRYGEGKLFTRNAGDRRIFWQGPSLGFDVGGDGARTMMLVYNMPFTDALYKRFVGVDGSAYFIGGFGVTAVAADEMIVVPIRAGVGARLGVNIGYLKFTPEPTWNPF